MPVGHTLMRNQHPQNFVEHRKSRKKMTPEEYRNSHVRIGFMQDFPQVGEPTDAVTYKAVCRGFMTEVSVSQTRLSFGDGDHTVAGVVTSRVDISHNLPMGGFNSHCCYDEAETMDAAIAQYCEENGLELCRKINSWPYGKAVVQKAFAG